MSNWPGDESVEVTCGCGWRRTLTPDNPIGTARSAARYAAYVHQRNCGKYLPRINQIQMSSSAGLNPGEVQTHEFSGDGEYIERCRFCGGYPFALQHWTI